MGWMDLQVVVGIEHLTVLIRRARCSPFLENTITATGSGTNDKFRQVLVVIGQIVLMKVSK